MQEQISPHTSGDSVLGVHLIKDLKGYKWFLLEGSCLHSIPFSPHTPCDLMRSNHTQYWRACAQPAFSQQHGISFIRSSALWTLIFPCMASCLIFLWDQRLVPRPFEPPKMHALTLIRPWPPVPVHCTLRSIKFSDGSEIYGLIDSYGSQVLIYLRLQGPEV